MKRFTSGWIWIATGLATCCALMLEAAPVRFALLTDPAALDDTVRFLRAAGCEPEALSSFETLASNRTARLSVDLSRFHRARNAFYDFPSVDALVDAVVSSGLCGGTNFDFNCFDAAFLLAGAGLQTTLKPDDLTGTFLVYKCETNYGPTKSWVVPAATPRDAFTVHYGGDDLDYGRVSTARFPQNMRDPRVCLTAALFGVNVLPNSVLTNCSGPTVLPALRASWRRSGLRFPRGFELLLLHRAEGLMLRASHAGLVFPRGSEFTYIEKTCGAGYFIRLDVSERTDIFEWVGQMHTDTNTLEKVFLTLNENITELSRAPH